MGHTRKKVVVIGGGIAGLASTYYLQKEAREKQLPIDTMLIEASAKLGGKIQTVKQDGFVIERGPDSFLARKTSASKLIKEVGLEDRLVNNTAGKAYVLVKDKLHGIPEGSTMGIPTRVMPFVFSGLFSPIGKLRAGFDFVMAPSQEEGDQPLGTFFRRRLGDEVVENLIEPLLSGIYAGDIDQMSLMATFPQFHQIEQKYGSIVRGMRKAMPPAAPPKQGEKKKGIFLTLTGGLGSLVEAVEERLEEGSVLKSVRVDRIEKNEDTGMYTLTLSNKETIEADAVIAATPHQLLQKMFAPYKQFDFFKHQPATSVANVAMAFPESAIKKDIDGTGFVVSRNSDYTITACTWTHRKWPHTTPEGKVLLRCYVGRPGDEEIVEQTDGEIVNIVLEDLKRTMDIMEQPEFAVVTRWKDAMPQYTVGHKERLAQLAKFMKKELPGIYIAGSSYSGSGLPDCILQGEEAVKQVLDYLFAHDVQQVG
ncbi:protoporphyrinogen oxidase [Priestia taiwanensis]|uniref:Coproporphyrinogen III oxidase n=1 Tax=Priestia taiwanensis TaxID=1347902 RepID=A0A917ATD2_9BACI|nr:protoporphyrinogen oxidase [Priestia taiwanensis]MBM7364235.1 oxygen-dependent protoporphyrinogen oxidase [Priestia taiwanensis]GGE72762.1 protoporphyrinogen oxidase [Priestia taiwanensis]